MRLALDLEMIGYNQSRDNVVKNAIYCINKQIGSEKVKLFLHKS